jgi:hypothetical protein
VDIVDVASELDPGVGSGKPRDVELELEFKVLELARPPDQPSVLAERFTLGDFTDDGSLFDPPVIPVTFPALQGPVEDTAGGLGTEFRAQEQPGQQDKL